MIDVYSTWKRPLSWDDYNPRLTEKKTETNWRKYFGSYRKTAKTLNAILDCCSSSPERECELCPLNYGEEDKSILDKACTDEEGLYDWLTKAEAVE